MNLGAPEIALIVLAVLLLFGYKKLPDASRSLGRSLRIFKGEMKGMKDDVRTKDDATAPRGELAPPAAPPPRTTRPRPARPRHAPPRPAPGRRRPRAGRPAGAAPSTAPADPRVVIAVRPRS